MPVEIPTGNTKQPLWKRWWVLGIAVLVVVGVIAAIAGGGDDDETPSEGAVTSEAPEQTDGQSETGSSEASPVTEAPDVTDAPVETDAPVQTDPPASGDSVPGAPDGATGDRSNPVPSGAIANIGEGFRLQVVSITDDATDLVMAENEFNDPPPDGSRFTLVEVALGYYGFDDPQSGFLTSIQAVGSESTELESDCGVVPNSLDQFNDMFSGGVIRGNICFITTAADTGVIQVYVVDRIHRRQRLSRRLRHSDRCGRHAHASRPAAWNGV